MFALVSTTKSLTLPIDIFLFLDQASFFSFIDGRYGVFRKGDVVVLSLSILVNPTMFLSNNRFFCYKKIDGARQKFTLKI